VEGAREDSVVGKVNEPLFFAKNYPMEKGLGHMEYRQKLLEIASKCRLEM